MSWVTVIWSMLAAVCLMQAAIYFGVWYNNRAVRGKLFFALAALGTAALAGCELWLMQAETPAQYATAVRWTHVPLWLSLVGLVGFVQLHLQTGRRWLAWSFCVLRTFSLLLNFLAEQNLNYVEISSLRAIPFLGESVSVAEGVVNPWMLVGQLSLLALWVFLLDALVTARRHDNRRQMLILGSFILFVSCSNVLGVLVIVQAVDVPVIMSLFYVGVIAVMSIELVDDSLLTVKLSQELCNSKEWLDLTADSSDIGLWSWDFKTGLIWATERTRHLYGFTAEEPIPFDKFLSRLHPGDHDWVMSAAQKCIKEAADFRADYRIVLPDGEVRWFKILAKVSSSMPDVQPERMTGVSIDITSQKQLELALQQKRNELNHVARVSTMGQLSSTLAHELSQPLGAMLRNAEAAELIMQEPAPDFDELRVIMADIRKDDQRAGEVISRMRLLMKYREIEYRHLDLNLLAGEVISMMQSDAFKRHVRLQLDFDTALPHVHGDWVQLQQVLINLLSNAMDALDTPRKDEHLVTVCVRQVGQTAEIEVTDNGFGIAADKLPRIFEPFYSSKPNGLGMGLSISREIIEMHGGQIKAENRATGGATFTISLPIVEGGTLN